LIPSGLIGVVHVPALPGDPRHDGGGFAPVERFALRDAEGLVQGGVKGLILENFGSAPFPKGTAGARVPPHHVAFLTLLAAELKTRYPIPVGVNCLRNDARSALGAAAASGADFIRVNVHTGAYVTDQGVIEGEAYETLRYRASLGAGAGAVSIAADVLVKHAAPLAPLTPEDATHDCVTRGLADAVIVTGEATGAPVSPDLLRRVAKAAGDTPVLLGSGLTPDNAPQLAPLAQAGIVGTWVKQQGDVTAPVDPERVATLVAAVHNLWKKPS
jgi:membrane complex biogenesis BtpA family protein